MKRVIQVSGEARQVFKYLELLKRYKGNVTLKDLEKKNQSLKLDMKS